MEHEALFSQANDDHSNSTLSLPHDDRLWRARSPGFYHATSPHRSLTSVCEINNNF